MTRERPLDCAFGCEARLIGEESRTLRARWVVHTGAVAAVLVVGVLSLAPEPAPTASVSTEFDCQPRPLARIPPGTRIADVPPDGWTHLISKSLPELATGDVDKLHPRAAELAQLLFSCLLARVDRQETLMRRLSPGRNCHRPGNPDRARGRDHRQPDPGRPGANLGFLNDAFFMRKRG